MAKSSHIRVLLVRSGANKWDDEGRLSGSADLPFSASGQQDIESRIAALAGDSIKFIGCGPEETTRISAEMLADQCQAKVKVYPAFHEVGLGLWEGMLVVDAAERHKTAYRQWREDPAAIVPPGGEKLQEASVRIVNQVRELLLRCKADATCGVGIVLRPMAYGLVHCWLGNETQSLMWSAAESEEGYERFMVDRQSLSGKTPVLLHSD